MNYTFSPLCAFNDKALAPPMRACPKINAHRRGELELGKVEKEGERKSSNQACDRARRQFTVAEGAQLGRRGVPLLLIDFTVDG